MPVRVPEDERDHRREHRPLVDVARHEVHQGERRWLHAPRPRDRRNHFREFGEKRRHPLHQEELADPEDRRHGEHRLEERVGGHEQQRAPRGEQPADGRPPAPAGLLAQRPARHRGRVRRLLDGVGRMAREEPEVAAVHRGQHRRVPGAERSFGEDDAEVEQHRDEREHLDRVLALKRDRGEGRPAAAAAGDGVHAVHQGPAEAEQQADRSGEVRDSELGPRRFASRVPCDDRLDREFGRSLKPRQHREGQALGDEELRRFRAPGDEERGREQGRKGPQRGKRGASRRRQGSEYL